ncbi:MAG TPA: hypothetical protein PKI32_10600, partial [Opitutales bacterium]|nr:hypothetical protein [Opitutales bacterium]
MATNARADWRFHAAVPGSVLVQATAESPVYSDGMEMPLEVVEHGYAQMLSRGGRISGGNATVTLALPEHREGSATLEVEADIGLAPTMLRALPYLVNYPYHCSEQTTSRVVPLALLVKRLSAAGVDRDKILAAAGIASQDDYEKILHDAKDKLGKAFNYGEGGWGWFDSKYVDDTMTAYVYWGQMLLRKEDAILVFPNMLEVVNRRLVGKLSHSDGNADMQAWLLFALVGEGTDEELSSATQTARGIENDILDHLASPETKLRPASLAMTAMSAKA